MEKFQHSFGRLLAAAAFVGGAVASAPSSGLTITVNGSCSASVSGSNVVVNCDTSSGTTCSVSPASQTVGSSGGPISLTASNCGTGSWTSTRSGAPGGSSTTYSDSLPASTSGATYTYTFTGSNGSDSATVTQLAGTSSPPPTGPVSCNLPGISNVKVVSLPWQYLATTGNSTAKAAGGFGGGDAVVFAITPPAGTDTGGKYVTIGLSPTNSQSYNQRSYAISTSPCDFSRSLGTATVVGGQSGTLRFTVGGYPLSRLSQQPITTNADLVAGRTYYVSVVQQALLSDGSRPSGVNTCMNSSCDVNYQLIIP
jgi:hypothetical protein